MLRAPRNRLLLALVLVLAACDPGKATGSATPRPDLALFGSVPLYWGENDDIAGFLADTGKPDWVRSTLEQRFTLTPLDALERDTLAGKQRLLLAQPRPLAPSENVALDAWVRGGGRALIFADPMLTRESRYPLGDKRRPQDTVLLSPILGRWGLELHFDEHQPEGERVVADGDLGLPVRLAGSFTPVRGTGAPACIISSTGLIARCHIGKGQVTLLADAALLDGEGAGTLAPERREALDRLVAESLGG